MEKHFRLILKDDGTDIYRPRQSQNWGYRYGPTVMVRGNVCEAWFASPGDGYEADWFTYRKSTDGGKTWSDERVVMTPVPDSMDWFSVCDPAVFKYGKYYYIGYTSTVFEIGGGVCNNGFIARSTQPTGPFERWCGDGWGETRNNCKWMGKPAPVIYYDEDWHNWGAGEWSFVVKDKTLYMYYTWLSKDRNGKAVRETRVATADLTNPNWPGCIVCHGAAAIRLTGSNDSYDVVYCEDLDKFIALSTDNRFSEDSFLAVYESNDGLKFRRVNEIKARTGWMCHNCGISGDEYHHIRHGDTMLLAYAYGNKWGQWGTRVHAYDFEAMDDEFYSERDADNQHIDLDRWPDPEEYEPSGLFLKMPHFMRVKVGDSLTIPMRMLNVAYKVRSAELGKEVRYTNYDKEIINIRCGVVTARKAGYTYVTAAYKGLKSEFLITVYDSEPAAPVPMRPYPDKKVVFFEPIVSTYRLNTARYEMKQLRGLCTYADGSWFEVTGNDQNVFYDNHNPELFDVDKEGHVLFRQKTGTGSVTLTCGKHSFDVTVILIDE